jgi:23S rRNA pseudouridine1911/1915/1917 synthase
VEESHSTPRILTADRGDAGRRLDLVLRRHLRDVAAATRTRVQTWIEAGRVTVNGTHVHRVATRLANGDIVRVAVPEARDTPSPAAEDVPLEILYEDTELLVVSKAPGVVVHPTYKHSAGTLMNALLWYARSWPSPLRPSIVGRLDKLTSGLVIVAKTPSTHAVLQRAWSSDRCTKDYLALVYGRVNPARGRIDLRLRRDPTDRRRVIASDDMGAASLTAYERIGRSPAARGRLSLLRCRLLTGRTHQIRVHMAARGWPIVGDAVYGAPRWKEIAASDVRNYVRQFPRQALHAWCITFAHPVTGDAIRVQAPVPADLVELLGMAGVERALGDQDESRDSSKIG